MQMKKHDALQTLRQIDEDLKTESPPIFSCLMAIQSLVKELFEPENHHYITIGNVDKFATKHQKQILQAERAIFTLDSRYKGG